jgi:hypothetical protein
MSIEPLIGANYPQWREMINMGLVIFEIDKAITDKRLEEPTLLEIPDDLDADDKAEREKENRKLMGCYEIDNNLLGEVKSQVPHGREGENLRNYKGSKSRLCHCCGVHRKGGESVQWLFKGICEHSHQETHFRKVLWQWCERSYSEVDQCGCKVEAP